MDLAVVCIDSGERLCVRGIGNKRGQPHSGCPLLESVLLLAEFFEIAVENVVGCYE